MLRDFFATKLGMTQAWTKDGKRIAITRCKAQDMRVTRVESIEVINTTSNLRTKKQANIVEVGVGTKKLAAMTKPLRSILTKSGFSEGALEFHGIRTEADEAPAAGDSIAVGSVLAIGDVVQVQGTSKGRGFAGAVKRFGFAGGPATHGQSDRERAVGSIGAGTTPGRVWKGKKMPGQYGVETKTVTGLVVVHIDPTTQEVWLSGPVPGPITGTLKITKTGGTKQLDLDYATAGITPPAAEEAEAETTEAQA